MRYYPQTVTISTASPAVFTLASHGLVPGDEIILFTTSALPTGLTATTGSVYKPYYVVKYGYTTSTFCVSESKTPDFNGSAVVTTADGAGTQTFLKVNHDKLAVVPEDNR